MEIESKWMRKFFPRASERERSELLSLWRRMELVQFPPVLEDEVPQSEDDLLAKFPRAVIRDEDIGGMIGRGNYGAVHPVTWKGKPYAMKSFSDKFYVLQELGIQSKLDYPHIVPVAAYTEIPRSSEAVRDKFCILMELMDGSIQSFIDNPARSIQNSAEFDRSDALEIMLQLGRALMFMHSKKIMHRDVKPANVLYRSRPRSPRLDYLHGETEIKMADFGTSRLVHDGSYVLTAKKGTKCYWAPEVVRDGETCPYTDRADVYSFGMTCYAIATGRTPLERYMKLSPRDFQRKVRGCWMLPGARPRIPRWMDPSLARIIKQCWDSRPEERPPMKIVCWALEFIMAKARNVAPELSPALYPSSS